MDFQVIHIVLVFHDSVDTYILSYTNISIYIYIYIYIYI